MERHHLELAPAFVRGRLNNPAATNRSVTPAQLEQMVAETGASSLTLMRVGPA